MLVHYPLSIRKLAANTSIKSLLQLACALAIGFTFSVNSVLAAQVTTYKETSKECNGGKDKWGNPADFIWVTTYECKTTEGQSDQNTKLKAAVLSHSTWGAPTSIEVFDENGDPLNMNGTDIVFETDQAAADEAELLYGNDPNYGWHGFVSTETIASMVGESSAVFDIVYTWHNDGVIVDHRGESWLSDDGDDIYGYDVVDVHSDYEVSTESITSAGEELAAKTQFTHSPNPIQDIGSVSYNVTTPATVKLELVNSNGESLGMLTFGQQVAGTYNTQVSTDELAAGVYFLRLYINESVLTRKMVVVK